MQELLVQPELARQWRLQEAAARPLARYWILARHTLQKLATKPHRSMRFYSCPIIRHPSPHVRNNDAVAAVQ
ncbi:MAG TPA: hypothetical protein EYN86_00785 [Planctomycetes bacterium]|nr:hypothetical protein [Planctomycetota bacterium]